MGSDPSADYSLYRNGIFDLLLHGNGGDLTFGNRTDSGTYTVTAFDITNQCSAVMPGSPTVRVNPLPAVYNVGGTGGYCAGSIGRHVTLDYSITGVNYKLFRNLAPTGDSIAGANSSLDFGSRTSAIASGTDNYTIEATNASTGCSIIMNGAAAITEYPLPNANPISTSAPYCAGDAGVPVTLTPSEAGIIYQLYKGTSPLGAVKTGLAGGGTLSFGVQTAGSYTIVGRNPVTTCSNTMAGTMVISVNQRPTAYTVTGGGHFCAGSAGASVFLNNSTNNVNYQLQNNGVDVPGGNLPGTGFPLDFGTQTGAGIYTIIATDAFTPCSRTMSGSATIVVDPAPTPKVASADNGGNYCAGGVGQHIRLAGSSTGISYQLVNGGNVGAPLLGTGSALDFGLQAMGGTYSIVGTNVLTHCTNTMTNSPVITINMLPNAQSVIGGGNYCAGGAGATIQLANSDTLVNYQLYNGTTAVGAVVPGNTSGNNLTFDPVTATGLYTAVGIDAVTGCRATMSGSANVNINPLPTVRNVTGGGSYCAGSTGVHVGLDGSQLGGYTYWVYNDFGLVGTFWAGTGLPLDFGANTVAGTYSVVATNATTGCSSDMMGSVGVAIIPTVPTSVTVVTSTGSSTACSGGPIVFTPMAVNGGTAPGYQWKVNGSVVSTSGTFSYTPSDNDTISVRMASNAVCPSPAFTNGGVRMTVITSQLPTVHIAPSTPTSVCPGSSVTFTAAKTYAGAAPSYSWQKNGMIVGTDSTYTVVPNDSDIIFCSLTSDYACRLANTVYSNNVVMDVIMPTLPVVSVTADPGVKFAAGSNVTFTATAINAGAGATYKWKVNSNVISGATNAVFNSSTLKDNDLVTCEVSSHTSCGSSLSGSHTLLVHDVTAAGVNNLSVVTDLRVMPNPNKGAFTVKGTLASDNDQEVVMEVTNMLGQVVYSNKVIAQNGNINEQLQLNGNLANGMYLLNVRTASGSNVFHFVIEQ